MDAARYSRLRELFLAAEELPPGQQEAFLHVQTAGDSELFEEVRISAGRARCRFGADRR